MKNILYLLIIVFLYTNGIAKESFLVAPIQFGNKTAFMNQNEIYSALVFAINLAPDKNSFDRKDIDSILAINQSMLTKVDLSEVGTKLGANNIVYSSISTLNNIVRTEIKLFDIQKKSLSSVGIGYAVMNLRDVSNDNPIYIPAVIKAYQRAFASALGDSMLYDNYRNFYRVYPSEPAIIAGLEFKTTKDSVNQWYMFNHKQIISYDIIESMLEYASMHPTICFFDTQSRDTLYSLCKIYETSNYTFPSHLELSTLKIMGITYFISGTVTQIDDKVEIELFLFKLKNDIYEKIKSAKRMINKDQLPDIRFTARLAITELLYGQISDDQLQEYQERYKSDKSEIKK